ncbi:MAG: hypothetical protein ABIJ94_03135 [candidate division WOR-3 bacterium]
MANVFLRLTPSKPFLDWRPIISVLLVLIITVAFNLCCQRTPDITNDLQPPAFKDGEQLTYGYFLNDTLIGKTEMRIYFDIDDDIPIYCLEIVTEREEADNYISDSSVVYFRRDNFQPIWSYRMLETDFGWRTTETHYSESDIDVWVETVDGKETFSLSLSPPYFDSEMLLALLRAVQFKRAKKYTFTVFNPLMQTITKTTARYHTKTMIPMTSEFIECDKLQLAMPFNEIVLFYEHRQPRRLIKFQEKRTDIVAVLLSE